MDLLLPIASASTEVQNALPFEPGGTGGLALLRSLHQMMVYECSRLCISRRVMTTLVKIPSAPLAIEASFVS